VAEQQDRGPEHWQGVLADLRRQVESRTGKVAELTAQKRALALSAATGDTPAQKRLTLLNSDLVGLRLGIEDLEAAIGEAEQQLVEAEAEAERQREHAKRCKVSDMCERRVELAGEIDAAAAALGGLLGKLDELHRELLSERPADEQFARLTEPYGRLRASLLDVLPGLFTGGAGVPVRDPRRHRAFQDLEIEALAPYVLSEDGKQRAA
jgi:chromosome segregation ATPase